MGKILFDKALFKAFQLGIDENPDWFNTLDIMYSTKTKEDGNCEITYYAYTKPMTNPHLIEEVCLSINKGDYIVLTYIGDVYGYIAENFNYLYEKERKMKIIVCSEELKQEMLEQSEYLHDHVEYRYGRFVRTLFKKYRLAFENDSEEAGEIMHIHLFPDIIEVDPNNKTMKIIVNSDEDKEKLLQESEYLHDNIVTIGKRFYSNDCIKGGSWMHLYMAPEIIEVDPTYVSEFYQERI